MRRAVPVGVLILALGAVLGPRPAAAQAFSVSGSPPTLRVNGAIAGSAPTPVTTGATTYSLTNLVPGSKIRARLSAPLPAGVTLRVSLQAPSGGTTVGWVTLTTTDQLVIDNVPVGVFANLQITYELSATAAAGVVALNSRVVSLTLSAF